MQLGRRVARLEAVNGTKTEAATFDMSRLPTALLKRLLQADGDGSDLSADDWTELDAARVKATGATA